MIATRLRDAGYESWLVGGSVRDQLLGRESADFDLTTNAEPNRLLELFPEAIRVGAHFGVVLVRADGSEVQVATYRSDAPYSDGRHPDQVTYETDVRKDVLRRDFTVNALLEDPFTGKVLDYTGGMEDLESRTLRAIGDPVERFREDHLRMLRAVRFAAKLNFTIEEGTLAAIRQEAASIGHISAERIREELNRIFTEGHARRGLELLDETRLLLILLPEVAAMKGVPQPPEYHPEGDVWVHTLMLMDGLTDASVTLAWGALLHDVGKPPSLRLAERIRFDGHVEEGVRLAGDILRRLRFSTAETDQILALVANHMRFMDAPRMKESTFKRFLRLPDFEEHLELHRLDCMASHGGLDNYEYVKQRRELLPPEQLRPIPLIRGGDLQQLGYKEGPQYRDMLEAIEEAQLSGEITSRDEALALLHRRFPLTPAEP